MRRLSALVLVGLLAFAMPRIAQARIVYECLRDNRLSLATVPEPGSRCKPKLVHANRRMPNYWGSLGPIRGPMYQRRIGGVVAYSTRAMRGWTEVRSVVALGVPSDLPPHAGMGQVGAPRLDAYAAQFRAAAKRSGVDDAWLRAIAHAESDFDPRARSPRGAQGLMQLMPAVARVYGVADPYSPTQSIDGAARHLRMLKRRYGGDLALVAAAYNAGTGAVTRYHGVPPYAETQAYVDKVQALYARYRSALRQARPTGS